MLLQARLIDMMFLLLAVGCSALIPNIGLFIALTGALSSSVLSLVFPPIIDLVHFWKEQHFCRLLKNILLMTLGLTGFLVGSYVTLRRIIAGKSDEE
jgi:proton-coupled amino acid transporter